MEFVYRKMLNLLMMRDRSKGYLDMIQFISFEDDILI